MLIIVYLLRKSIVLPTRYKQLINYILGPILFLVLSYSIYQQIISQPNLALAWKNLIVNFNSTQIWLVVLFFLLWVLNWWIEIVKWNFITQRIEPNSFLESTKAVLLGQSFAFNSFNNFGEALGRSLCLKPENRAVGGYASIVSTISMILVTLFLGSISGIGLHFLYPKSKIITLGMSGQLYLSLTGVFLLGLFWCFKWYYNLKQMPNWVKRIAFGKKNDTNTQNYFIFSKKFLTFLLLYSLARCVVYSIQFVLTLKLFAINTNLLHTVLLTFALFSLLLIIPSLAFTELAIRGQLSLFLFNLITVNSLGVLFCSAIFWLINKVVPAIFGTVLALTLKIYKSK